MDWKKTFVERATEVAFSATQKSKAAVDMARQSATVRSGVRAVIQNGPTKELARLCVKTGFTGAVVEGVMGAGQAAHAYRRGQIDERQALIHTSSEAGAGFVTSVAGTAGTLAVYMVTGTLGPVALIAGAGASAGTRHLYKRVVGETLPEKSAVDKDITDDLAESKKREKDIIEHIGPRPVDDD
ncbi:MAG: hypothetical protein AAGI01_08475 [Myxococcota bacterium]